MDKQKNIDEKNKITFFQSKDVNKNDNLKQPIDIITKMLNKNLFNYDLDSNNVWARMNYEEIMRY